MKRIVVNGTFDILHSGHLALLNYAKSQGDFLVVAIDSGSFTVKTDEKTWVTLPLHKLTTEKYALIKTEDSDEMDR